MPASPIGHSAFRHPHPARVVPHHDLASRSPFLSWRPAPGHRRARRSPRPPGPARSGSPRGTGRIFTGGERRAAKSMTCTSSRPRTGSFPWAPGSWSPTWRTDVRSELRVNDRGPFVGDRIVDVSYAAGRLLGMIGPGVVPVRLTVTQSAIAPGGVPLGAAARFAVQVGSFIFAGECPRRRAVACRRIPRGGSGPPGHRHRDLFPGMGRELRPPVGGAGRRGASGGARLGRPHHRTGQIVSRANIQHCLTWLPSAGVSP